MSRFHCTVTLLLALAAGCSGHRTTQRPTPARDPSPPLTRSDTTVFDVPTTPPDTSGGGNGAGSGHSGGTAIGNAGNGNGGGNGGSSGGHGAAVPEPGTMLLVGSGLAAAALARRRRKAVVAS